MIKKMDNRQLIFGLGVLLLIVVIGLRQIVDIDIWWHIQLGEQFTKEFGKPDFAQFYFTPISEKAADLRYTWLGDILFYLVFNFLGEFGLQMLRLTLMALTAATLWDIHGRSPSPVLFLLLGAFFLSSYQFQLIRNALYGLPLFMGLFWLWWKVRFQDQDRMIWWVPVLLTLWSCLHGTFMVGCAIFFFLVLGETYEWLGKGRVKPGGTSSHKKRRSGKKKSKSKNRDMHVEGTGKEQDLVWNPFFRLKNMYFALILSFIGTVSFNAIAVHKLRRFFSDYWWVLAVAGVVCIGFIFLHRGISRWVIKQKEPVFQVSRILLVLVILGMVGWILKFSFTESGSFLEIDLLDPLAQKTLQDDGFLTGLKNSFNNLFVVQVNTGILSTDFLSPWDFLDEIYISISFLLGLVVIVLFLVKRPVPRSLLFSFFPIMILSFGYKRTAGYLGMISVFCILILIQEKKINCYKPWLWVFNGCGLLFLMIAVFFFPQKAGLWETHVPGFGRAPIFSTACADDVLEKEGSAPIFTNITNGGFLLRHWFSRKRVFIDGYFAPHKGSVLESYNRPLLEQFADPLEKKYGIHRAIVTHRDLAWVSLFSRSKNWYPESVDCGMLVYIYQPDWDKVPHPEVFLSVEDFDGLPGYFKPMISNRLVEIPTSLVSRGLTEHARVFLDDFAPLMERAKTFADTVAIDQLSGNLAFAEKHYGSENSPFLFNEFQLQNARRQDNPQEIIESGSKIWVEKPRIELGLFLVDAYRRTGNLEQALSYLNKVHAMYLKSNEMEDSKVSIHQKELITTSQDLVQDLEREQLFKAAFNVYKNIQQVTQEQITNENLIQLGLSYFKKLREVNEVQQAYDLLLWLRQNFPESPYVLHNLSILVFENFKSLGQTLNEAESFAVQAISLGEASLVPQLDYLYKNLSDILLAEGKTLRSEMNLDKARDFAPAERKHLYRPKQ